MVAVVEVEVERQRTKGRTRLGRGGCVWGDGGGDGEQ
jgi:hypothetical protein